MSEAFVYCWTNTHTGMMYIGSHRGDVYDGYVCSSKYMLKEYKDDPTRFVRSIVAHGTEADIRKLETTILRTIDAANDERFYDLSNHSHPQKSGWRHSPESIRKIRAAGIGNTKSSGPSANKRAANSGRKRSPERRAQMQQLAIGNKSNTGRIWINNGTDSIMISKHDPIPAGYMTGRGKKDIWSN